MQVAGKNESNGCDYSHGLLHGLSFIAQGLG
jgi:hypothetical protein